MKPHFTWSRGSAGFTLAGLLLSLNSCSFLYKLNTNQCNSTADCHALGSEFADSVCKTEEHVCVALTSSGGGAGQDGSGGASASASGGSSPHGGGSPSGGRGGARGGAGGGGGLGHARFLPPGRGQGGGCPEKAGGQQKGGVW